nr:hypothetical protein [Tanacetum cinerariifolium]
KGGDEVSKSEGKSDEEKIRQEEEESFDPIPRTPEGIHSDGQQESSSTSSFVTSLLNPIIDLDRVKSLEVNFSEFMRTNQFPKAVSNIPENDEFPRTIDDNIKKIIKEQVKSQVKAQVTRVLPRIEESMNAQLEAEVLTRSSHSSRTSYAVAADLSEMELNKILIDKMEGNKREDNDDQEGPFAGSDRGSKRRREGGEHASTNTPSEPAIRSTCRSHTGSQSRQMSASESAFQEEPVQTTCQMDEPSNLVFETGAEDQPIVQTSQHPEWFSQPRKPPTPDRDWNKTLLAVQGSAQLWISELAKQADARSSFNELLDTPLYFFNFIMNRLDVDTLTPELLACPTYELMRGSCQQYLHNLLQPLPLIPDNRGRRVIPFEHFINNDLEYLRGEFSSTETGLVVPVIQKGDDPIDAINHMMSFLISVVTS